MSADVILLSGSPGSGKSTVARRVAAAFARSVHLHTDDFWRMIVSGGVPPYLPEADAQNQTVMAVIQRAAWRYAAGGFTTVVDGVIGPWMLSHFDGSGASDAVAPPRVHLVVLRPSREEALRRAQSRSGADALVDAGPVTALWDQFADLGDLERHVIDSTMQTPGETVAAVRTALAGGGYLLTPA